MKNILMSISILLLFLLPAQAFPEDGTAVTRETQAAEWFAKGVQHFQQGEYDNAIEDYTRAIELNPGFAQAYINRGQSLEKRGLNARAREDYNKVAEMERSAKVNEWFSKGRQHYQKGEFELAVAALSRALELDPLFEPAYIDRGLAYGKRGFYARALEDFNKVVELDKSYQPAYSNRGYVYYKLGRYDLAVQDYTKAISLRPNDGPVFANRGAAFEKKGQLDKAMGDFNRALAIDPRNAEAYNSRGAVYYKTGDAQSAADDFEKACSLGVDIACKNLKTITKGK